ncbi:unnamed protein product [Hymenolepis diminuta]|uniref:Uncharacterized protein n=1 Tax=Hymenolepis diminuta TaxID=6216 RepID=A0A564Z1H7_HYMDI|nr:unnamed protein product [Hymenolepis diminuta]
MGKLLPVMQEWASTHIKICKRISIFMLLASMVLIITGAILAAQNNTGWINNKEDIDVFVARQSRYAGGIAMILVGVFFFVFSLISFCFAFQMKYVERAVQPGSNQTNHQIDPQMPPIQPPTQVPYPVNDNHIQPPPAYYLPSAPISVPPPPYKE